VTRSRHAWSRSSALSRRLRDAVCERLVDIVRSTAATA
jgi:hypothetical protein